ncbi:MAG: succinyl-diaminopimelate desuccinylase [Acidimicrobiia bacterium]|nr:succinyl-diaminopimelate desuccinylase [Acidimicrobiia bacterium]
MTLLETLIEIVDIPSVTGDEDALCTWIVDRFAGTKPVERIGNSVVVGSRSEVKPFYALYGHIDTVPVQGDPKAMIIADRIRGLGVGDMKAGLAVMIELLDDPDVGGGDADLVCVFYDKEEGPAAENGLEAVLDQCPWLLDATLSIVMEPTDLNLELGCNGVLNADVIFTGSSAHSARPWLGENAVTKAGSWLEKLHDLEPQTVDIDGLTYREVFSVTQAHGGIANNIIPPKFVVNLNHRFPPIYTIAEAEARLRDIASDADEVVIKDRAPAGLVASDNSEVERLDALIGRDRVGKQGWTDVARLTSRGAIAVNYGPGEVAQAHQVDESMPIENLTTAHDVMRRFLTG